MSVADISYTKMGMVSDFVSKIGAAWHRAVESIIEVGRLLNQAEKDLGRNGFVILRRQLETDNIMSGPTISKLRKIANNAVLTAPDHIPLLPPSYESLYILARKDRVVLERAFQKGVISPQMQQRDSRLVGATATTTVTDTTAPSAFVQPEAVASQFTVLFQVVTNKQQLDPQIRGRLRAMVNELKYVADISVTNINV